MRLNKIVIMENQANSQLKQSLIYGGILGLVVIVVSVIAYMLGFVDNKNIQWINYAVQIAISFLGLKNYRDQHLRGYISYGNSLGTGFLIGMIGGVIGTAYFLVFINYIDTEFVARIIEKSQEQMAAKGISDDQIEMAIKYQQKFMSTPWMAVFAIFANALFSFIFSAIISIFVKKNNESFEANFSQQ